MREVIYWYVLYTYMISGNVKKDDDMKLLHIGGIR